MDDLGALHHVALSVRDRDRSAEWYVTVLGMAELFREETDQRRACVMRFAPGGYSVALVEHIAGDGSPFDPRRTGLDHLAFTVASRAELDRWAEHLDEHRVEHSDVVEIPPGAILNLKDLDGISLALFWDETGARSPGPPVAPFG